MSSTSPRPLRKSTRIFTTERMSSLREGGYEPLAIVSHLARIGTSDPLEPGESIDSLAAAFTFGKMARHPGRYDPADLARLNAAVLHAMSYAEAQPRLADLAPIWARRSGWPSARTLACFPGSRTGRGWSTARSTR